MALSTPFVSQYQDVIRCDVCDKEVGELHCDTCQVYVCDSCVGEHIKSDLSKQHLVVESRKRSTIKLTECRLHGSKRCDLHCKQCNVPVCSKCMASKHVNHTAIDVLDFCRAKQEEIKNENKEIELSKIPILEQAKSEIKTQTESLSRNLDKIKRQLIEHSEVWHKQIDVFVKEYIDELDEIQKAYLRRLRTHQQELEEHIILCRQVLDENTNLLLSREMSYFNEYKSRIHEIKDPVQIDIKLPKLHTPKLEYKAIKKYFGSLESDSLEMRSPADKSCHSGALYSAPSYDHTCHLVQCYMYLPQFLCSLCKTRNPSRSYQCTLCKKTLNMCTPCMYAYIKSTVLH